jgi:hypothetical protein
MDATTFFEYPQSFIKNQDRPFNIRTDMTLNFQLETWIKLPQRNEITIDPILSIILVKDSKTKYEFVGNATPFAFVSLGSYDPINYFPGDSDDLINWNRLRIFFKFELNGPDVKVSIEILFRNDFRPRFITDFLMLNTALEDSIMLSFGSLKLLDQTIKR